MRVLVIAERADALGGTESYLRTLLPALAARGDMAIVLVEQYFDFARALAQRYIVMERGEVVLSGDAHEMVEEDVRRYLTV